MRNDKPLCKVPIGSAYQRPLRTEQTYEEAFWQTKLLQRNTGMTVWQLVESVFMLLALVLVLGAIYLCQI